MKIALAVVAFVGGVTALAKNADTLVELWQKNFGSAALDPLQGAHNLPPDIFRSISPVSLELVQVASDRSTGEKTYDLYFDNSGDHDVLLTELRYAPGVIYTSASSTTGASAAIKPNASYVVLTEASAGSLALSPPYSLHAKSQGAIRLHVRPPSNGKAVSQPLGFDVFAANGEKIASVNMPPGR